MTDSERFDSTMTMDILHECHDAPRKRGWNDRDVDLDSAVCEITINDDHENTVRLCFKLNECSYEIEHDELPERIREAFEALA